jgi:hypothetical protein
LEHNTSATEETLKYNTVHDTDASEQTVACMTLSFWKIKKNVWCLPNGKETFPFNWSSLRLHSSCPFFLICTIAIFF